MTKIEQYGFTEAETEGLRALRRAARDIHASSVMRSASPVGISLSARTGVGISISRRGHDEERFRSFVIGLRRTYNENDLANFRRVANVVARRVEELRPRITQLRDAYKAILSGQVTINGLNHEQVFEAWLHGYLFHDDDPENRNRWQALANDPLIAPMAQMVVEATAIPLADAVLALDDIVADILEENRLSDHWPAPAVPVKATEPASSVRVFVRPHHQKGVRWIDIENVGHQVIQNVMLDEFTPLEDGRETALVKGELQRKLPAPRLRPREKVSLMAALTFGTPLLWRAVVSWEDSAGTRLSDDFRIDLAST